MSTPIISSRTIPATYHIDTTAVRVDVSGNNWRGVTLQATLTNSSTPPTLDRPIDINYLISNIDLGATPTVSEIQSGSSRFTVYTSGVANEVKVGTSKSVLLGAKYIYVWVKNDQLINTVTLDVDVDGSELSESNSIIFVDKATYQPSGSGNNCIPNTDLFQVYDTDNHLAAKITYGIQQGFPNNLGPSLPDGNVHEDVCGFGFYGLDDTVSSFPDPYPIVVMSGYGSVYIPGNNTYFETGGSFGIGYNSGNSVSAINGDPDGNVTIPAGLTVVGGISTTGYTQTLDIGGTVPPLLSLTGTWSDSSGSEDGPYSGLLLNILGDGPVGPDDNNYLINLQKDGNTQFSVTLAGVTTVAGNLSVSGTVNIGGALGATTLNADNGASGTFTAGAKTITVVNGIITSIV